MSLKTSGSEKVPYSKSSCLRLFSATNSLNKITLFLVSFWPMINTEERTLIASPCVAVWTHLTLFISGLCKSAHPSFIAGASLKTNQLLCAWLTFIFIRQPVSKKNIWRNLTVSQYFRPVVKMGPKSRKTLVTVK